MSNPETSGAEEVEFEASQERFQEEMPQIDKCLEQEYYRLASLGIKGAGSVALRIKDNFGKPNSLVKDALNARGFLCRAIQRRESNCRWRSGCNFGYCKCDDKLVYHYIISWTAKTE